MHSRSWSRPWSRSGALLLLVLAAACGEQKGVGRTSGLAVEATDSASLDVATAEWVVGEYFRALEQGRIDDARNLLAPGPRSDASEQDMQRAAAALRGVRVATLLPVSTGGERQVFRVNLEVPLEQGRAGAWREGSNLRWIEVVHDRRGWRIARIDSVPVAAAAWWPVRVWSRLHILDAGISLDVPHGWLQRSGEWAWSPPAHESQRVGVQWRQGGVSDAAAELLPAGSRILGTVPVETVWGTGTRYTLQWAATVADGVPGFGEYVVVTGADGGTFVFYATASTAEELRQLHSVLRRMYISSEAMPASSTPVKAGG
jgi:hypothetical protein